MYQVALGQGSFWIALGLRPTLKALGEAHLETVIGLPPLKQVPEEGLLKTALEEGHSQTAFM